MTDKKHEDIARKIRALLAKAEDSAATEGEAVAASQKAKELMDKYQISMGEAELLEDGFENKRFTAETREQNFISQGLAPYIALFTETKCILIPNGAGKFRSIQRIGLKTDVMLAEYFSEVLTNFVIRNAKKYSHLGKVTYESHRTGLIFGINDKIKEVVAQRKEAIKTSGKNELVAIDKNALVSNEFAKLYGGRIGRVRKSYNTGDAEAYHNGKSIGRKVNLSEPVSSNSKPVDQIGR